VWQRVEGVAVAKFDDSQSVEAAQEARGVERHAGPQGETDVWGPFSAWGGGTLWTDRRFQAVAKSQARGYPPAVLPSISPADHAYCIDRGGRVAGGCRDNQRQERTAR